MTIPAGDGQVIAGKPVQCPMALDALAMISGFQADGCRLEMAGAAGGTAILVQIFFIENIFTVLVIMVALHAVVRIHMQCMGKRNGRAEFL